jgi:AcrR family transcriptional regulator
MAPAVSQGVVTDGSRPPRRVGLAGGAPSQRDRLVAAMGELVAELGGTTIGVHHVCQRAGISRRTFYELYDDRDDCLADTLAEAQARLLGSVGEAVATAGPVWESRVVAAVRTLVAVTCTDPVLGCLCFTAPLTAGRAAGRDASDELGRLLGEPPSTTLPSELLLVAALGGVWEMLRRQLVDPQPQGEITAAAIACVLTPFVGRRRAATRASVPNDPACFVARWTPSDADEPVLLITALTRLTLEYLDEHPDATNVAIARAVDVRHESQMSRHLARLRRDGVVQHRKQGRTNAWRLTSCGEDVVRSMREPRHADG